MGTISTQRLAAVPLAPSSKATGTFTAVGTTRSAGHAQSPITSAAVRCRPMTCATAGSTRRPIRSILFIRDIADGDLVGWIDRRLQAANDPAGPDRLARLRDALIAPLREIYGVSDKVLTMALSCILLGAPKRLRLWHEVGASMIAIDTLVHNFLHRTGILHRFGADHAYGSACYQRGGCADIIEAVAERIDASAVQSHVPGGVSAVRPARDLAVLRPERSRCLQRQSHR